MCSDEDPVQPKKKNKYFKKYNEAVHIGPECSPKFNTDHFFMIRFWVMFALLSTSFVLLEMYVTHMHVRKLVKTTKKKPFYSMPQ